MQSPKDFVSLHKWYWMSFNIVIRSYNIFFMNCLICQVLLDCVLFIVFYGDSLSASHLLNTCMTYIFSQPVACHFCFPNRAWMIHSARFKFSSNMTGIKCRTLHTLGKYSIPAIALINYIFLFYICVWCVILELLLSAQRWASVLLLGGPEFFKICAKPIICLEIVHHFYSPYTYLGIDSALLFVKIFLSRVSWNKKWVKYHLTVLVLDVFISSLFCCIWFF